MKLIREYIMLKYTDAQVTFREVPDEITLCINISGCPNKCDGCHSSYLSEDIGDELNEESLEHLIKDNNGITCICFMGGDQDPEAINKLAFTERNCFTRHLKICWYSGKQELSNKVNLQNFDYIKLGPYKAELGPLNSSTTNQRFYQVSNSKLTDITYLFYDNKENQ